MTYSLTEIANTYGTDKGTTSPGVEWGGHNYTDIYEAYLKNKKQSTINILEIGLGVKGNRWDTHIVRGHNTGGASLKMWYDYFPNSKIYGIDINECSNLNNDRIKTFVVDQGNIKDLDRFIKITKGINFDIIIDDGSHRPDHQQISFSYLFKKLKNGGLYFIEDLLSNGLGDNTKGIRACDKVKNTRSILKYYAEHGEFLEPNLLTDQTYLKEHIDYLNFHVPHISVKLGLRINFLHPIKKIIRYTSNTESLCVIRKK